MVIWFKQQYVLPIITGEKEDTLRKPNGRAPAVGERVLFSVGPRTPFAEAIVCGVDRVAADEIAPERLDRAKALLGGANEFIRIDFVVTRVFHQCVEVRKALTDAEVYV